MICGDLLQTTIILRFITVSQLEAYIYTVLRATATVNTPRNPPPASAPALVVGPLSTYTHPYLRSRRGPRRSRSSSIHPPTFWDPGRGPDTNNTKH